MNGWLASAAALLLVSVIGLLSHASGLREDLRTARKELADTEAAADVAHASARDWREQHERTSKRLEACVKEHERVTRAGADALAAAERRTREADATARGLADQLQRATRAPDCAAALAHLDSACAVDRY